MDRDSKHLFGWQLDCDTVSKGSGVAMTCCECSAVAFEAGDLVWYRESDDSVVCRSHVSDEKDGFLCFVHNYEYDL